MEPITIKLLHERRNNNPHRKVDGRSGERYIFEWREPHLAYCYVATKQEEIDDLFSSQGRGSGSYFAPVIVASKPAEAPRPPLTDATVMELLRRELTLPDNETPTEAVGLAVLAAYEKGVKDATPPTVVVPVATIAEPVESPTQTSDSATTIHVQAEPPPEPLPPPPAPPQPTNPNRRRSSRGEKVQQ